MCSVLFTKKLIAFAPHSSTKRCFILLQCVPSRFNDDKSVPRPGKHFSLNCLQNVLEISNLLSSKMQFILYSLTKR